MLVRPEDVAKTDRDTVLLDVLGVPQARFEAILGDFEELTRGSEWGEEDVAEWLRARHGVPEADAGTLTGMLTEHLHVQ